MSAGDVWRVKYRFTLAQRYSVSSGSIVGADGSPYHPLVVVLEDEGVISLEQARHDDMTAFDQPWRGLVMRRRHVVQDLADPGTGSVRDGARVHDAAVAQLGNPTVGFARRTFELNMRADVGTAFRRVERVEDHQSCIVDPAVRIDETAFDWL
jgi:hypothetical protein